MEEATGAPSSFTVWDPKRLRASGRDGGGVVNRPPSPLRMLLSRHTRRREFIALVGGAAAWPLVTGTQQGTMIPRIGVLAPGRSEGPDASRVTLDSLVVGLRELGYPEGQNIANEHHFGESNLDRLREVAAELVKSKVDVIVALSTTAA